MNWNFQATHPFVSFATERHASDPRPSMIYNARKKAKALGLPFNLPVSLIEIPEYCPVLGVRLEVNSTGKGRCSSYSPTLYVKQPEMGYRPSNVAVISLRASRIIAGQDYATIRERLESGRIRGDRESVEAAARWLACL